jgi:hypothetical protein
MARSVAATTASRRASPQYACPNGLAPKVLSGFFDSVTATSDGIDRLEPCEAWRPYVVAAIPGHWVPTERKTGLDVPVAHRQVTFRRGWLELEAA